MLHAIYNNEEDYRLYHHKEVDDRRKNKKGNLELNQTL